MLRLVGLPVRQVERPFLEAAVHRVGQAVESDWASRAHPRAARRRYRTTGVCLCVAGAALMTAGAVLAAPGPVPGAAPGAPQAQPVAIAPPPPPPSAPPSGPSPDAPVAAANVLPLVDPEAAPPGRVVVPSIGVDSPLVGLRRQRDGTLEVPKDFAVAGWYRAGVRPGDTGPAVLVGHVDSYVGPAVFFRLHDLREGDRITIDRTDGSQVVFAVYAVEGVSKQAFPTDRVYGDTPGPELRLLTCSGRFDPRTKHYEDNTVVYAREASA